MDASDHHFTSMWSQRTLTYSNSESGAFCYFILKSNSTSKAFLLMILPLISFTGGETDNVYMKLLKQCENESPFCFAIMPIVHIFGSMVLL